MLDMYRYVTLRGTGVDITFTNKEDVNSGAMAWLTDLKGWFGGVGVVATDTQRTLGHGLFEAMAQRTGRPITVQGELYFDDEADRDIADRFLSGLLWDGEYGEIEVLIGGKSQFARVRLDGAISHSYIGTRGISVQIPLVASDPRIYDAPRMVQVFPAGFGEGLVYPLFTTKGAQVSANKFTFSSGLGAVSNVSGLPGISTSQVGGSVSLGSVTLTAGRTYTVRTLVSANKPGSRYALRATISSASGSNNKYIDMDGTSITPIAPVSSVRENSFTFMAPPGATGISLTLFPNHSAGSVTDASQTIAVSVAESIPVLDWGKSAPIASALPNEGNADAFPVITVRGDFPAGFNLTWNGRSITYPSTVTASTPVVVDSKTGSVLVGGMDQTYKLTSRDWFSVPAGSSFQPKITALAPSNGWADVSLSSTYM